MYKKLKVYEGSQRNYKSVPKIILSGQWLEAIGFSRVHIKKRALNIVLDCLNYCKNLLFNSQIYVENYYADKNCNYVEHRLYNPKTYIFFETEKDYKEMKNIKNHYHFIEVNPDNILSEYQIMLVNDCTSANSNMDRCIELYNSVYPIIMLKSCNGNNIVGILKPKDNEIYNFGDEHNLVYRKYKSITSNYQTAMFAAIANSEFHIYPYLTEMNTEYSTDSEK